MNLISYLRGFHFDGVICAIIVKKLKLFPADVVLYDIITMKKGEAG